MSPISLHALTTTSKCGYRFGPKDRRYYQIGSVWAWFEEPLICIWLEVGEPYFEVRSRPCTPSLLVWGPGRPPLSQRAHSFWVLIYRHKPIDDATPSAVHTPLSPIYLVLDLPLHSLGLHFLTNPSVAVAKCMMLPSTSSMSVGGQAYLVPNAQLDSGSNSNSHVVVRSGPRNSKTSPKRRETPFQDILFFFCNRPLTSQKCMQSFMLAQSFVCRQQ